MLIGQRLRDLRKAKGISQGDIEESTGLLRCYLSRVENGHTVPSLKTLEKWARALDMPLYKIMYEGQEPPKPLKIASKIDENLWGNSQPEASELNRLRRYLAKMNETERKILLFLADRMADSSRSHSHR